MVFLSLKKVLETEKEMLVCGMDEAGRGPWAGPVVACALMLKGEIRIKGLKNSKALTAEKREEIYEKLKEKAWFGVGVADHAEIDRAGLLRATHWAFDRALEAMLRKKGVPRPELLIVDGRDKWRFPIPHKTVIKGDEKIKIVACASIVAKVERDRIMRKMAKKYPQYGFDSHMGYGTARHHKAIKEHGICEIHRRSFEPVARLSQQMEIF